MTQRELIDGCRKRDRNAQHELYAQTSERIYALLLKMTRNSDTAFDLSQETYIRAFTQIGQFNGQSSLATWLYRIAVNEALQFLRRSDRLRSRHADWSSDAAAPSNGDGAALVLDVDEALSRIEEADRAILLLRHHEGLNYAAIAEVMDCPEGTVASRLNRARQHMRELLGPAYAQGEEIPTEEHQIRRGQMEGEPERGQKSSVSDGGRYE